MKEIITWSNNNSGWASVLIFAAGILITFSIWLYRRTQSKPHIKLELHEEPTLCTTFGVGINSESTQLHRTAFLIYLKITNFGKAPVQIGEVHLGYRSCETLDSEGFRWLTRETAMLDDYTMPIGEKIKVFPFLKQRNFLINNNPKTYLLPGEYVNGLVYFEQDDSVGLDYPYIDADFRVLTKIKVHDTFKNYWETEFSVVKVVIEAIRKNNPNFGKTKG